VEFLGVSSIVIVYSKLSREMTFDKMYVASILPTSTPNSSAFVAATPRSWSLKSCASMSRRCAGVGGEGDIMLQNLDL